MGLRWRSTLWCLAGVVMTATAHAQTTVVAPGPAQRCLTRGGVLLGTPVYPQQAYEEKASGVVTVDLEFSAPDAEPSLRNVEGKSSDGERYAGMFERSVRDFARAYRVPCLQGGETARLRQEFRFLPHDRRNITLMTSSDERQVRAGKLLSCVKHQQPKVVPDYPVADLRAGRQGTAVLRLEFSSQDGAPQTTVLDDGGGRFFGEVAMAHASGYRLPCHDRAGPVDFVQLYVFKIEGDPRVVLRDMPLLTLMSHFKGIRSANVYFDTNRMGCPFDVSFELMQPHALNEVGSVGRPDDERRFFLDWLRRQALDMPAKDANALLGQHALVSVPCVVINLGSREGGGASQ